MSDTVKKWAEMTEENPDLKHTTPEERREIKIDELLALAVKSNKLIQVTHRAKEVRKEYNSASLLLGLQIACDELCG